MNDVTTSSPASDDTVEFELSEDELLRLSQAAEAAQPQCADAFPVVVAPKPVPQAWGEIEPSRAQPQKTIAGWAGAAAVYAAFMAFAWWGVAAIPVRQTPPAAVAKTPHAVVRRTAVPASPPAASVQVRNPFDVTEIFEFPAGTGEAEGREKAAQLLLQRARERRAQWAHIKPKVSLRLAKN